MLGVSKYNLNLISYDSAIGMVNAAIEAGVNVTELYVDTVGDAERYTERCAGAAAGFWRPLSPSAERACLGPVAVLRRKRNSAPARPPGPPPPGQAVLDLPGGEVHREGKGGLAFPRRQRRLYRRQGALPSRPSPCEAQHSQSLERLLQLRRAPRTRFSRAVSPR